MTSYNSKGKRKEEPKIPLWILLPLMAVLAVIPLFTFQHNYDTKLGSVSWFGLASNQADFFLYFKMVWLIITSIVMVFCLAYLILAEEKKIVRFKMLIPLGVYMVLSLLSALFSANSYFSFNGAYEQFESVWVLLGYGIITYYAVFLMGEESALRTVMRVFLAGITIMTLIGLSQALEHDFFRTGLGQAIMQITRPAGTQVQDLVFKFEAGRPYLTVYNPNYVGCYVALTVPVLTALVLVAKKIWQKIFCGFLIVSLIFVLFASQSRAGMVGMAVGYVLLLLFMRKVFAKNWKLVVCVIVFAIAGFFAANAISNGVLVERIKTMFTSSVDQTPHPLEHIFTNDKNLTIQYNGNKLVLQTSRDQNGSAQFKLADQDGNEIKFVPTEDNSAYQIQDERFPFTFAPFNGDESTHTPNGFIVTIDGKRWNFSNEKSAEDSSYYVLNFLSVPEMQEDGTTINKICETKYFKMANPKQSISYLENHYGLANNRGYIWARTIPLMKKYFFLGSGPDTFAMVFPNTDLVGLYNSGHDNEMITKPHCMYLQIAVQTGVPSLIALLVFFGWYIVSSIRLYWNQDFSGYMPKIGACILCSVIGYLILGVSNDSCNAIAPIFFALLGTGIAINQKLKNDRKTATEK